MHGYGGSEYNIPPVSSRWSLYFLRGKFLGKQNRVKSLKKPASGA